LNSLWTPVGVLARSLPLSSNSGSMVVANNDKNTLDLFSLFFL
jgi:hypothetical protein